MADSESGRSLSGVTRRALLASMAAAPLTATSRPFAAECATAESITALYQQWQQTDAEALHWSRKWGDLEAVLGRAVGYPRVSISSPSAEAPVWVSAHDDIDRELADRPGQEPLSATLHAELADQKMRWDMEAEAIGLSDAEREERLAWEKRQALADHVFSLPGYDLADVITKLALILRMGEIRERDDEFPWPQIDSVIRDLRRLAATAP